MKEPEEKASKPNEDEIDLSKGQELKLIKTNAPEHTDEPQDDNFVQLGTQAQSQVQATV